MTIFSSKSNDSGNSKCNGNFNVNSKFINPKDVHGIVSNLTKIYDAFSAERDFENFTTETPLGSRQHFFPRSGSVNYIGTFQIHRKMGLF